MALRNPTGDRCTQSPWLQPLFTSAHWVVPVSALGLTTLAWSPTSRLTEDEVRRKFTVRAGQLAATISSRMGTYEQVPHGAAGLFAALHRVERKEWHDHV